MQKNALSSLCGTYENVARAIASRHDIRVIPSSKCMTDGRTIYFPANADHLSDATREVLAGINDHEVGHICEEDKHKLAGKQTPIEYLRDAKTNKERALMNVYEDIRMEAFQALGLVGVAENLAALSIYSTQWVDKRVNAPGFDDFWYAIGCAIVHTSHGIDLDWMPESYRPYVDAIAEEITESNDTTKTVWAEDCWNLVQRTLAKFDNVAEELSEETERREEAKADEGDEDQGGESGSGGSEDDSEGNSESNGDEEGKQEDGGKGAYSEMSDDDLADANDLVGDMEKDATADDLVDEVKSEINREAEDTRLESDTYSASPEAMQNDRWVVPGEDEGGFNHAKQAVMKQIRGMKGKMLNLIKTQAEATLVGDRDHGDLDPDVLYSVKIGNRRVFTQTVDGITLDTAVSVLIDQSGSMGYGSGGGRAYYAKLMTVALAETFNALNVPFEIIGFHNDFHFVGSNRDRSDHSTRSQPYEFQIYKAFGEKYRRVKTRLGSITGYQDNADGEAVLEVAKRLAVCGEKRKIMFVLSDGEPYTRDTNHNLLMKHLKEIVGRVTAAGIEVVGIGAQTDSVRHYYNAENGASCIVIDDINTLAVEVYKTMRSMMLNKGRKKHGQRRVG